MRHAHSRTPLATPSDEVVRVFADNRIEEIIHGEQEAGKDRLALQRLYESTRAELAPFTFSLSAITPFVSSLSTYTYAKQSVILATFASRRLSRDYQQMQTVDSDLALKITRPE